MKTWKRRLAAVLAAVMLVSLLPVTALAEETETLPEKSPAGSDTGENPVSPEPEETMVNPAPEETMVNPAPEEIPVNPAPEETPVNPQPEEPPADSEPEESGLEIQELGVTIGGQYVAAVPVDELPPEELSPREEELLAEITRCISRISGQIS